jgi:hypothetical protein
MARHKAKLEGLPKGITLACRKANASVNLGDYIYVQSYVLEGKNSLYSSGKAAPSLRVPELAPT